MMSIVLLQAATGEEIAGPRVRVPPGNYAIKKSGNFESCHMSLNGSPELEVNSFVVLSNHTTVKLRAVKAQNFTVKFQQRD